MAQPVNIVYRSRPIQYPLLAAVEACNGWERAGLDLQRLDWVKGAAQSDPMLLSGEVDFVFGSHISPYLRKASGQPFVYLAQTVNWVDDALISREPMTSLRDLNGLRLAEKGDVSTTGAGHANHTGANHLLYLRKAGVDLESIQYVKTEDRVADVLAGRADAAFAVPPTDQEALAAGLHILDLDPMPMIYATTLTTVWSVSNEKPELCLSVAKAVAMGIHFLKTETDAMWEVMQSKVGPTLGIESETTLRYLQRRAASILEPMMYPRADAIINAFDLAIMEQADLASKLNPLSLWNLQYVRELEESGFFTDLYDGKVPSEGRALTESRTTTPV